MYATNVVMKRHYKALGFLEAPHLATKGLKNVVGLRYQ
jgi:hypothetical protein